MKELTINNVCEIRVYSHPMFGDIRLIPHDEETGKTLYCAQDMANSLKYANSRKSIADHCPHVTKRYVEVRTGVKADGTPAMQIVKMSFIPEGDVYRLMAHSHMPEAEEFEHWLFDEVAVQINHTGMYINANALMATKESAKVGIALMERNAQYLRNWLEEQEKREEAERQLALAAPKVEKYDQFMTADGCLVKEFAATLCKNGVTHILLNGKLMTAGQNHLFASLREHKFLCSAHGKRYNLPMQKWIDAGYFTVKTNSVEMSGAQRQTTTTIITPAGQAYLLDFYKEMTK